MGGGSTAADAGADVVGVPAWEYGESDCETQESDCETPASDASASGVAPPAAAAAPAEYRETPRDEAEATIQRVASKAAEWASLPVSEKKTLFKRCLRLSRDLAAELADAACASRGLDANDPERLHYVADAVLLGSVTVTSWLRGAVRHLEALERTGRPPRAGRTVPRPNGTARVHLRPANLKETVMQDAMDLQLVVRGAPEQFNPLEAAPSVTGVLGAGNTEILNDIVDPLCRQNSVVVYKANPVMARSNLVKARILSPLLERGYLGFIFGGAEQGRLVVESEVVDRIVITGSHHTFDRIVWGDRDKRDPAAEPVTSKPVMAELGSVNPYFIVPGVAPWSPEELREQAEALVAYKLMNSSHVCASPQVLITCRNWPQREEFLSSVRSLFASAPRAHCFYPGIEKSYAKHLEASGGKSDGDAQWTPIFQEDLPLSASGGSGEAPLGLREEAFCPVLYEVAIDCAPEVEVFMRQAGDFAHAQLWGSLTCTIVIDDGTRGRHREAFERALDGLRFGTIAVNVPAASANVLPGLAWGAHPGHDARDVQSGIGYLGNLGCWANVEKCIVASRFSNLQTFGLAEGGRRQSLVKSRAEVLAAVFSKMSYARVARVLAVSFAMEPKRTAMAGLGMLKRA